MKAVKSSIEQNPLLSKAAELIISHFKTPEKLFGFINDAMEWSHTYCRENGISSKDDQFFVVYLMNKKITEVWFSNLADSKKLQSEMMKGLYELFDYGYCLEMAEFLINAYAHEIEYFGISSFEENRANFNGIRIWMEVGSILSELEPERRKLAS